MVSVERSTVLVLSIFLALVLIPVSASGDSPQPRILLVEDSHYGLSNSEMGPYYENATDDNYLDYDICRVKDGTDSGPGYDTERCTGGPEDRELKDYDLVIWFTGRDYQSDPEDGQYVTLTPTDRNEISKYLDDGGKLFITGQHIGYSIGTTDFYENYLHADFENSHYDECDYLDGDMEGVSENPIGSNLLINIYGGADNQESPSIISTADDNASEVFNYNKRTRYVGWGICQDKEGNYYGAINSDTGGPSGYKNIYFGFGFEGINTSYKRYRVMDRSIDYLRDPKVYSEEFYLDESNFGGGWTEGNLTCDPTDSSCHRELPRTTAYCYDFQYGSDVSSAEYFLDSYGEGNGTYISSDDGSFDSSWEEVNDTVDIRDEELIDTKPNTVSDHTLRVHCRGGDNYWGRFADLNITIDRYEPASLKMDVVNYTGKANPDITDIDFDDIDEYQHYMRFSCDGSSWTEWIEHQENYSGFDITNTSYGCSGTDGNHTVYMQIRDRAGNWNSGIKDWVVLDREPPQVSPKDPSGTVNNNVTVSVDVAEEPYSSVDSVRFRLSNSTWKDEYSELNDSNGNGNYNSTYDTSTISDGVYNVTFYANDSAGNINGTEWLTVDVDNTAPEVGIKSPDGTHSGTIDLEAEVIDDHLNYTWYSLRNASDYSEIFKSGELECTGSECTASWNSEGLIDGTQDVFFNVSANDSVSQETFNINNSFTVDNRVPSARIVYPDGSYENTDFKIDLRTTSPGSPNVNISNAYYNISNSSWSKSNTSNINPGSIDEPGYNFTDLIDISEWCNGACADGNYSLYFWSNNTENRSSSRSSLFYIDTEAPGINDPRTNISSDPRFNDKRIFFDKGIRFSANVSDNLTRVDSVIVTVSEPGSQPINRSMSSDEGNVWDIDIVGDELGKYQITDIYANDTLGNTNHRTVSKEITVVEPESSLSLNGNQSLDAGKESYLNFTYSFNKTVTDPEISIYIPPNSQEVTGKSPYFKNVSSYSCSFNSSCQVDMVKDSSGNSVRLDLGGSGTDNNLTLSSRVRASALEFDRKGNWTVVFESFQNKNLTQVETPNPQITNASCDGSSLCEVNQSGEFGLVYTVGNINTSNHTGDAYNFTVSFDNTWNSFENITTFDIISSNSSETSSEYRFNITESGNYTFHFEAYDSTLRYNHSFNKTVKVRDVQPPVVQDQLWPDNNIFNRNESVNYRIKANDNSQVSQVWATVSRDSYVENVSFDLYRRYDEYDLWNMTYENDSVGQYNITDIYINDSSDNLAKVKGTNQSYFNITELGVSAVLGESSVEVGKDLSIEANVTGNASSIDRVRAEVIKPRNYTETVELSLKDTSNGNITFSGVYGNTTRSGDYSVNVTASLVSGLDSRETLTFTSPYGNSSIETSNLTVTKGVVKNVTWFLKPRGGDLVDLNGSVSIGNTSLMGLSSGETTERTIGDGNITWEEYNDSVKRVVWGINVSNSTGSGNITLSLNSSKHNLGRDRNKTVYIDVIPEDTDKPDIWSVSQEWNVTNFHEENTIRINATDNTTSVDRVKIRMDYPESGIENYSATVTESGLYGFDFSNTNETTNSTHRFNYTVHVYDLVGNVTVSEEKSFNVTDEYDSLSIDRTSNPYNKGENITFFVNVTNVHGEPVSGFNLSMNLSKNGTVEEIVNNDITKSGSYQIEVSDEPESSAEEEKTVTYTVTSLVTKGGNEGLKEDKFEVTEEIPTVLEVPDDNQNFDPGEPVPVKVLVNDSHGEVIEDAAVTASCIKCPDKNYQRIEWNSSMGRYYDSDAFTAPEDATSFSILIHSVDFWKNKGYSYRVPTTEGTTSTTEDSSSGGGGGGGGAAFLPSMEIVGPDKTLSSNTTDTELVVRTEDSGECEFSSSEFSFGEGNSMVSSNGTYHSSSVEVDPGTSYYFLVKCQVSGTVTEESMAFSVKSRTVEKFSVEMDSSVLVPRGENVTTYVDLVNEGDSDVSIDPDASAECCDLNFPSGNITVDAGSREAVVLGIDVPLYTEPSNYTSFLFFETPEVRRERVMDIQVSDHLLTRKMKDINRTVYELNRSLENLEGTGVDVTGLKDRLSGLKSDIKEARTAVDNDDMNKLESSVESAERSRSELETDINNLQLQRFLLENKWNITGIILTFLVGSYLIFEIIIPFLRLRNEISDLENEKKDSVQTRKKAERQYFRREIDEKTFRDIMTTEQDKILNLRGRIGDKQEKLGSLKSRILDPRRFLIFPFVSIKNIGSKTAKLLKSDRSPVAVFFRAKESIEDGLRALGKLEIRLFAFFKARASSLKHSLGRKGSEDRKYEMDKIKERVGEPEKEPVEEFEEEVESELEGIEEPEERISHLTELRRDIEKNGEENDKKD